MMDPSKMSQRSQLMNQVVSSLRRRPGHLSALFIVSGLFTYTYVWGPGLKS